MSETPFNRILNYSAELSDEEKVQLVLAMLESLSKEEKGSILDRAKASCITEDNPDDPHLSVVEAAKMLGVTSRSISRWFDTGRLRGYRASTNRVARIEHESLAKYLKSLGQEDKIPPIKSGQKITYSTTQVAKLMEVSAKTVLRWVKARKLRAYFIPGTQERRIKLRSVVRFAKETNRKLNRGA